MSPLALRFALILLKTVYALRFTVSCAPAQTFFLALWLLLRTLKLVIVLLNELSPADRFQSEIDQLCCGGGSE